MTAIKLEEMTFTRVVTDELAGRAGEGLPRQAWHRSRSLPALGMPDKHRRRRIATAVSVALHVLLIWLLVRPAPLTNLDPNLKITEVGGGGAGPAGGGGGGNRGTGGVRFIQIAPPPKPVASPPRVEPVLPPVKPVIEPPKPALPEPIIPQVELPKPAVVDTKAEVKVESPILGSGGGTGNDGTRGNGPGTGGGIGSGVGTGRGSGVGPGTGGGPGDNYLPTLIEMPIPPQPVPKSIDGTKVIAKFDIDKTGKILRVDFTPTKDDGYNRKLNDLFKTFRFRPAVTRDGVPIRATYPLEIIL